MDIRDEVLIALIALSRLGKVTGANFVCSFSQ